jgi:hypothetical protein
MEMGQMWYSITPSPQTIQEQNLEDLNIKMTTTNKYVTLKQKQVFESHKPLGTHKCIKGKETEQITQSLDKSESIARLATNSQLNKRQSWQAYSYYYIPAMPFSLIAVSMSEAQSKNIRTSQHHNSQECVDLKNHFQTQLYIAQ